LALPLLQLLERLVQELVLKMLVLEFGQCCLLFYTHQPLLLNLFLF
jgi:hypothetical protein